MIEKINFNAGNDLESLRRALSDTFRQLNKVMANQPRLRVNVDTMALSAASASAGGLMAWKNTQESDIIIVALMIDIVTGVSGLVGEFGTAANGTTLSDNLMDGMTLGNTSRVANSADSLDAGTNGRASQRLAEGEFITGSVSSGNPTGLVAYAHILWVPVFTG